jgi:hypothetical protein
MFTSMHITRPLALATLALASLSSLTTAAHAQKLSVTPAPGLWESTMSLKLNGVDIMAGMKAAQAEAMKQLKDMPPAQRAEMEKMMQQALGGAGAPLQSCLTPEQARMAADPQALLRQMTEGEDAEQACRFELQSVSGNTMKLRGTCKPEDGWNGVVTGTMTQHDPKRWSSRYSGQGRMQGDAMPGMPGMPGMSANKGAQVEMLMESSGRWLAADCGQVAPER